MQNQDWTLVVLGVSVVGTNLSQNWMKNQIKAENFLPHTQKNGKKTTFYICLLLRKPNSYNLMIVAFFYKSSIETEFQNG